MSKRKKKTPETKFPVKKTTNVDDGEWQRQREKAALIYDAWKKSALAIGCRIEDLPGKINALMATLEAEVDCKYLEGTKKIIEMKLADIHQLIQMIKESIVLLAHCPHRFKLNGVGSHCDWTGLVTVPKARWEAYRPQQMLLTGPECGHPIRHCDCRLPPAPDDATDTTPTPRTSQ